MKQVMNKKFGKFRKIDSFLKKIRTRIFLLLHNLNASWANFYLISSTKSVEKEQIFKHTEDKLRNVPKNFGRWIPSGCREKKLPSKNPPLTFQVHSRGTY